MKLFLASQDLGDFADVLNDMVGGNKRALIISNARDYYHDAATISSATEKTVNRLENMGFVVEVLDLKKYFNKTQELQDFVAKFAPSLIFSIGGRTSCLATALHVSGMDKIIRDGVLDDKFIYGGYSAGAMVAAKNLKLYYLDSVDNDTARETYGIEPYEYGIGLTDFYIVPHADHSDYLTTVKGRIAKITQARKNAIRLNDADVYVVNGANSELLKGKK